MAEGWRNLNTWQVWGTAGVVVVGICGGYALSRDRRDYEGVRHAYVVEGKVNGVEPDGTVHLDNKTLKVIRAIGKATGEYASESVAGAKDGAVTFEPGYTQEEDGFFHMGRTCELPPTNVGEIRDAAGAVVAATELQLGTPVQVTGNIREQSIEKDYVKEQTTCETEDVSVYTEVKILPAS